MYVSGVLSEIGNDKKYLISICTNGMPKDYSADTLSAGRLFSRHIVKFVFCPEISEGILEENTHKNVVHTLGKDKIIAPRNTNIASHTSLHIQEAKITNRPAEVTIHQVIDT